MLHCSELYSYKQKGILVYHIVYMYLHSDWMTAIMMSTLY